MTIEELCLKLEGCDLCFYYNDGKLTCKCMLEPVVFDAVLSKDYERVINLCNFSSLCQEYTLYKTNGDQKVELSVKPKEYGDFDIYEGFPNSPEKGLVDKQITTKQIMFFYKGNFIGCNYALGKPYYDNKDNALDCIFGEYYGCLVYKDLEYVFMVNPKGVVLCVCNCGKSFKVLFNQSDGIITRDYVRTYVLKEIPNEQNVKDFFYKNIKHYEGRIGSFDYDSRVYWIHENETETNLQFNGSSYYKGPISLPRGLVSCKYLFQGTDLTGCWFEDFDTSNITDMAGMFNCCKLPEGFTLGDKFDTSKVLYMDGMFDHCRKFPAGFTLGDKFDTSKVLCMDDMFRRCTFNEDFKLGNKFYTSRVFRKRRMFNNCVLPDGTQLQQDYNADVILEFLKKWEGKKMKYNDVSLNKSLGTLYMDSDICPTVFKSPKVVKVLKQQGYKLELCDDEDDVDCLMYAYMEKQYTIYSTKNFYNSVTDVEVFQILSILRENPNYILVISDGRYCLVQSPTKIKKVSKSSLAKLYRGLSSYEKNFLYEVYGDQLKDMFNTLSDTTLNFETEYSQYADTLDMLISWDWSNSESISSSGKLVLGLQYDGNNIMLVATVVHSENQDFQQKQIG